MKVLHIFVSQQKSYKMNTYKKYCPKVYVAKCPEMHQPGDTIIVTTRHGKENECLIHNFVGRCREGMYYYSITRTDGMNSQERARRRAERLQEWADKARLKGLEWQEKSNEGKDFLVMAEPIKVGHHSEKRHRALIARNW